MKRSHRFFARWHSEVYTVDLPNVERTLPAEKLAECAKKYCRQTAAAGRIEDAVEKAMKAAERAGQRTADSEASAADGEPVILACGSLSYLGDVIRLVEKVTEPGREVQERKKNDRS